MDSNERNIITIMSQKKPITMFSPNHRSLNPIAIVVFTGIIIIILLIIIYLLVNVNEKTPIIQDQVRLLVNNLTPTATSLPTATPMMTATLRPGIGVCFASPNFAADIYSAPSYAADAIGRLSLQQIAGVTGKSQDDSGNTWYRFYLRDDEGLPNYWVASDVFAMPLGCRIPDIDY